ncbi:hypothetical protein D3C72_2133460 [compost metagenome]
MFAANIGQLAQLWNAGNQLFDADFRRLISRAVSSTGACTGDGAASGQDDYVRQFLLGFHFFCLKGSRQE